MLIKSQIEKLAVKKKKKHENNLPDPGFWFIISICYHKFPGFQKNLKIRNVKVKVIGDIHRRASRVRRGRTERQDEKNKKNIVRACIFLRAKFSNRLDGSYKLL